jgi:hypothetical protein
MPQIRALTEVSVARQSPHRSDADEPETSVDEAGAPADPDKVGTDPDEVDADLDGDQPVTTGDRSLWEELHIDPVEIALPAGSGFTLRAYRPSSEVAPTDVSDREQEDPFTARSRADEEDDDETVVILDEELAAEFADDDTTEEDADDEASGRGRSDQDEAEEDEDEVEDVPVFLSHRGKLLLFKSPESLVAFVRSGAPNDLTQLDTWEALVERIQPSDIAPLDEDSYELDLVVENLRGGHDVWDPTLLIEAGEIARDLAYALRLPSVLDMLSPGSSLDDLDEALRSTVNGGLGAFMARRRLKKIGAQTASLGWRTIIGKISASVDWRD